MDLGDKGCRRARRRTVGRRFGCSRLNINTITDGDGVRAADAAQPEIAFHLARKKLAVVRSDVVSASCVLDD